MQLKLLILLYQLFGLLFPLLLLFLQLQLLPLLLPLLLLFLQLQLLPLLSSSAFAFSSASALPLLLPLLLLFLLFAWLPLLCSFRALTSITSLSFNSAPDTIFNYFILVVSCFVAILYVLLFKIIKQGIFHPLLRL